MRSSVWETREGSGTHEEEERVILSFGEGLGCPPAAAMKPDDHVSMADSLDAKPGAHGTVVEVGLDLSFPITEVGCGLTKSKISRLGWEDSVFE